MADKSALEQRRIYYIPKNFTEGGGLVLGMFNIRNLVEGVILAIPGILIGIKLPLGLEGSIAAIGLLGAPFLALGIRGINGDCVSTFLAYFFKFRSQKRVIRYNPRVKLELNGQFEIIDSELPRERLMKLISNLNNEDAANAEAFFDSDASVVFADDVELKRKIEKERSKK